MRRRRVRPQACVQWAVAMGPLKSGCFSGSGTERVPAPRTTPTSPPSKTPPPPPISRRPHSPLPPPPPLPPGFVPLSLPSSCPPLPPPCSHPAPARHGLTPPAAAAAAQPYTASAPSSSSAGGWTVGGAGRSIEHLGGVPTPGTVPGEEERGGLAGVAPGLLPLKKRIVRYHPYAAAWAIQEIAAASRGEGGSAPRTRGAGGYGCRCGIIGATRTTTPLRAELARLRVPRPALVLTKRLTATDRSRDKARLLLPDALVGPSPLLGMLTAAERRLVLDDGRGLPVPALDRLGRAYRMSLRRDAAARSYRLAGQWPLFLSRHGGVRAGDAVEVHAFRPPAWQARLERHGEGGLGVALLHYRGAGDDHHRWSSRERDAADGLLLIAAAAGARRGHCAMPQPALGSAELVSYRVRVG